MAPKALIAQMKARIEAQKKFEEEIKKQAEEEEQRLREEARLAKEQEEIEAIQRAKINETERQKKKEHKNTDGQKRNAEIIERMRAAGMIMPEGYAPDTCENMVVVKQTEKNVEMAQTQESNEEIPCSIVALFGNSRVGKTTLVDYVHKFKKMDRTITQNVNVTFIKDMSLCNTLYLDLPGKSIFSNIHHRAVNLCDFAMLVISILDDIDEQTQQTIKLLVKYNCPFIIVVNKIDKLNDWVPYPDISIQDALASQKAYVRNEYDTRINSILNQLTNVGLNVELCYKNDTESNVINVIPVSATTGDGINYLMNIKDELIIKTYINRDITDELKCTILDIIPLDNFGIVADVLLSNGSLCIGDQIIVSGIQGNVTTRIKKLLIDGESCVKTVTNVSYVKIVADKLENAIPGSSVMIAQNGIPTIEVTSILSKISKDFGISIYSSSLSVIESIMLNLENVPVNYISLGPVYKKHMLNVIKTAENNPKFAVMLAFGMEVTEEAKNLAEKYNIKIFSSNIVTILLAQLKTHLEQYDEMRKKENKDIAVFPVSMEIIAGFHNKNPMVIGCKILKGTLRPGTPLYTREFNKESGKEICREIGRVLALQKDKKEIPIGNVGDEIAVSIQCLESVTFGRTIDKKTILSSKISRQSIDALKESFRDQMTNEDWKLVIELKKELGIA